MNPHSDTVRVMTWNIHGAFGRNRRFDVQRVVELVRRWDPDIIALQEVDSRRKIAGNADIFALLQDALGEHGVSARSIETADGHYGQLLVSCCPITASEVLDISAPEREPRRAIKADIATPTGSLRVIATHLGLSVKERREQTRHLLSLLDGPPMTTVVMGDFNDWLWAGSVRSSLARALPGRTDFRTFPSRVPLFRLDCIFCRPQQALRVAFRDYAARAISDHLPVIADIVP